ncbi:hypothetical protein MMC18_002152 [Xylographa bjoerkii]|nr:hypothetical protein [Xylographa bjoerkii]
MAEGTAAPPASATHTTNDPVGDSGLALGDTQDDTNAEEVQPKVTGDDTAEQSAASDSKTNGHTEHHDPPATSKPVQAADDVEMKDAEEDGEGAVAQPSTSTTAANGTPASTKKTSNGSSKKKSSVIPEHKSKKLNRKKSKPALRLEAKPGDLFLARMKGHQPWPSIICDEDMLPQILLSSRPITTAQPDGTFKKPDYADGGKRASERTFPIMFLQTNEFAWIINSELSPLTPEECKDIADKGKSKSLLEAYKIAAEGHDLAYFKTMLADHMAAMQEDADERAEREAKKASKAKRKSGEVSAPPADDGDADEMDVDAEGADSKPKSKKRKKSLESDGEEAKPAKTPKTGTKLKLSTPKTPAVESSSKKKAAKPKSSTKRSAAKASASDDEMIDTPMVEEKPLTPAEAKEKKEKEIRYYRHKLQKGFLSRDTVPAEEEIKSMSGFLSKLETYPDLEGSIIRATKIHKVLKAMIRLTSIPKDEEYQFKKRSHELLTKWNKILQDDPTPGGDKDDDAKDDVKPEAATTNGTSKEMEEVAAKSEAGEAAAPEEESEKALENKIGTTVEGEKEAAEPAITASEETAEETAEEAKTDAPNIDSAPAAEYQPPAETSEATEAS